MRVSMLYSDRILLTLISQSNENKSCVEELTGYYATRNMLKERNVSRTDQLIKVDESYGCKKHVWERLTSLISLSKALRSNINFNNTLMEHTSWFLLLPVNMTNLRKCAGFGKRTRILYSRILWCARFDMTTWRNAMVPKYNLVSKLLPKFLQIDTGLVPNTSHVYNHSSLQQIRRVLNSCEIFSFFRMELNTPPCSFFSFSNTYFLLV